MKEKEVGEVFPKDSIIYLSFLSGLFSACVAAICVYDWESVSFSYVILFILFFSAILCGILLVVNILMMGIILARKHYFELRPKSKDKD